MECGISHTKKLTQKIRGRIVNGRNVEPPHSQPWMVTVSETKKNSNTKHSSYGCGGTLISRKHVLSALHCARKCNDDGNCQDKDINWATLGDHDKTKKDGEVYVPITKPYYWHPESRHVGRGAFTYDYVIFVLECCVEFSKKIQPACLTNRPNSELEGHLVGVYGWGNTEYGGVQSPVLQYITVMVVNDSDCKNILNAQSPRIKSDGCADLMCYNPDYLMCLRDGQVLGKDACQDDSGGNKKLPE